MALPVYGGPIESRRAEALRAYVSTLSLARLTEGDVQFADVAADGQWVPTSGGCRPAGLFGEYARQMGALLRQEVDAIYVKGARGLQCARAGQVHVAFDLRNHPDAALRTHGAALRPVTVDEALLHEHPQVVDRFLVQILSAGRWAEQNPRQAAGLLSRETQTHEDLVREAYGDEVALNLRTDVDSKAIDALVSAQRFLLVRGFIQRDFDIRAWIDPQPLEAARLRLAREPGWPLGAAQIGGAHTKLSFREDLYCQV